ncbi:MAG: GH92 family glycosyl hydrolase [Acidobacteria bacterium]|nr:GH92 family glycosyl hydrolase [Acidobacteriota bacterium]
MKKRRALNLSACLATLAVAASALAAPPPKGNIDEVNTYIGTGSGPIGYGGTMPFVTPPFGMINWTPQTRQNKLSVVSYKYEDANIQGFMGTHQPAIWMGDYGYITLVPQVGSLATTPEARQMAFKHADEITRPDYYSVWMTAKDGSRIRAEMTATERCSYMRFTFPKGAAGRVLAEISRPGVPGMANFDAEKREITGYNPDRTDRNLGPFVLPNFKGYFVVEFRRAWKNAATYGMDNYGAKVARGAYAEFAPGETVEVRVGTSFLSVDQARENLRKEIPAWDFDAVRNKLTATWNNKLDRVHIEGASTDQRKMVYTALYHALLYPRVFSEYGRYYSAFDDKIHSGESYTAYSIWDTFRAESSMIALMAPERVPGMITALLQNYKEGGWMPKWPNPSYTNIMIGTHADSLVAEAINKGFTGFDRKTAWDAVYKDAMTPPDGDTTRRWLDREPHTPYEARGGLTYYKQLGYIPTDKTDEASSRTIEDSYDDWCVAQVAKALGREKDYEFFLNRSLNYKHLYNPALGLMNGRTSDGKWAPIGGPRDTPGNRSVSGWTEGDAWVYTWGAFHDIPGTLELMGGADKYNAKLDQHFAGKHNVHSNEPSHHYGYLYDYSGQPWKTQAKVREILNAEYANQPAGLDGDDDCGQMSSWYLFTAMGFYPVNPASGDYMIGSPMFSKFAMKLANGKTFTVNAKNAGAANMYIQSATLNGKPLNEPVVRYKDIMQGATLEFTMGPQPSKWASAWRGTPVGR